MASKTCRECNAVLELTSFYKHAEMADGHLSFCKKCVCARVKDYQTKNAKKIAAYERVRSRTPKRLELNRVMSRKYQKEKKAKRAEISQRWILKNPEKRQAQVAVRNAIRDGKIKREPCWCGQKGEAHHHDYSKPFDVSWFCRAHHAELHRLARHAD